jgi:hypothetical protein
VTRDERIIAEVQALARLDLEGLRAAWRRYWGASPRLRSPDLLRRAMAWRIQAAVFGDLDAETTRRLRAKGSSRTDLSFAPGTKLIRQWRGRVCEVEVTKDGYRYDGAVYRSLSEIARTITGTRWNGRRFFAVGRADAP